MEQQNLTEKDQLAQTLNNSNKLILRNLSFRENFKMGFYRGLGATIGLAIFFAVLGFLIRIFGAMPLLGEWLISLGNFLHR